VTTGTGLERAKVVPVVSVVELPPARVAFRYLGISLYFYNFCPFLPPTSEQNSLPT